jgi:uncharacterized membrane protein HdeD (DUF308 family)
MQTYSPTRLAGQYWWLLLIWGILVGLFGLCALFWPHLTLLTLIFLFGVFALVNGALGVAMAIQERRIFSCWWAALAAAVLSILVGLAVMTWPHVTALVILYLIATWAVITGLLQLMQALGGMTHYSPLLLGIAGAASIVLGLLLFVVSPVVALLSLVWVIGIYALVYAAMLIIRAFFYRSWARQQGDRVREPGFLP